MNSLKDCLKLAIVTIRFNISRRRVASLGYVVPPSKRNAAYCTIKEGDEVRVCWFAGLVVRWFVGLLVRLYGGVRGGS